MAAYGAQIKEGKTPAQAQEYLKALFHNVVSQDSSARNALQTFLAGRGDALIDYENEAITDQKKGAPIEYVIPKATILIQNPVARRSAPARRRTEVRRLPASRPPARRSGLEKGYRPVISGVPGAAKFPTPAELFTIDTLGGWTKVNKEFFEPETGIVTKIEQSLGRLHCQIARAIVAAQAPARARRAGARAGERARQGPARHLPVGARAAADRGARWRSRAPAARARSGARSPTPRPSRRSS